MSFAFIPQGKPAVNEIEKGQLYQKMIDLLEGGEKPRSRVMCLSLFDKKLRPKTNNIVIKFGMQKKNTKQSLTNQFHISNLALLCDEDR